MSKKKLAKVQDISGMKIYDGPDGPEMYTSDPKYRKGNEWVEYMLEAKRKCLKVKITYLESPGAEPKTVVVAPFKMSNSVEGWVIEDLPFEGFVGHKYLLSNVITAEITDETFLDPYDDPAYVIAEFLASRTERDDSHKG